MQRCEYCGFALPELAHFCGNCGHISSTRMVGIVDRTSPSAFSHDAPTFISSPSYPAAVSGEEDELDVTFRRSQPGAEGNQPGLLARDRETEETQAVLPDLFFPGMLLTNGQAAAGNVPMVQGTPQVGGVPMVPGTPQIGRVPVVHSAPSTPGNPLTGQGFHQGAASSAPPI